MYPFFGSDKYFEMKANDIQKSIEQMNKGLGFGFYKVQENLGSVFLADGTQLFAKKI